LGRALSRWTGRDGVLVSVEGHGREDLFDADLSRTVGWFTTQFPVALHVGPDPDWGTALRTVKERLRTLPHRGLSYGSLRYLGPADQLTDRPQISFNYHGTWDVGTTEDGLFLGGTSNVGRDMAADQLRTGLLDVAGVVEDGELRLSWLYS